MGAHQPFDPAPIEPVPSYVSDGLSPIPDLCTVRHLASLMHCTEGQVRRRQRAGQLRFLEVVPQIGRPALFSGAKVRAWIAGTLPVETGLKYFGAARRQRALA